MLKLLRIRLYDECFIANVSLFGSSDPDLMQFFSLNFKLCFFIVNLVRYGTFVFSHGFA